MSKVIGRWFILVFIPLSSCWAVDWGPIKNFDRHLKAELSIVLGGSGIKTDMKSGESLRLDYGHLGPELKIRYQNGPWVPYILSYAHKLFTSKYDVDSFKFKAGVGVSYEAPNQDDHKWFLEITGARSQLMTTTHGDRRNSNRLLYLLQLGGVWKLGTFKEKTLRFVWAAGPNFPTGKSPLGLRQGDSEGVGFRMEIPEEVAGGVYLLSLNGEREAIRSQFFHQVRYTLALSAGKVF